MKTEHKGTEKRVRKQLGGVWEKIGSLLGMPILPYLHYSTEKRSRDLMVESLSANKGLRVSIFYSRMISDLPGTVCTG